MPRTLTTAAQTEAAKNTGAFVHRLLQVDYPTTTAGVFNTVWYSSAPVVFNPGGGTITADPRVKSWGTMNLQADPNKMGGDSQQTIELSDPDHALQVLFDAQPGIQTVRVKIWLWFDGTAWSDAVCLFGGIISNPVTWLESSGTYRCTLKGYEVVFDRNLGVTMTRDRFNDVQCTDAEGLQLPIVFGNPCIRVPCNAINRPGWAMTIHTLGIHDSTLTIHMTAQQANFTVGSTITLIVGNAGSWEAITGHFATSTTTVFNITSRGAIEASGNSPGVYSDGDGTLFLINRSDIANPDTPRMGQPIWTKHSTDTTWRFWMVDHWYKVGSTQAVVRQPSDYLFQTGDNWKIGRPAGTIPNYPPGTYVSEKSPFVFAANFLPSYQVMRVEAKTTVQDPIRGGTRVQYLTYSNDSSVYTVNYDNRAYNTQLGRGSGDYGLTTITITKPPSYFGFDDDHLYVTLKGCTDDDSHTGNVLQNPAQIMLRLLKSKYFGNIDPSYIDTDSFSAASTALDLIPANMGFAITTVKKLHQTISEIAFQAMCLYFWDGGKACLSKLKVQPLADDSSFTIDASKYRLRSLQTDQYDVREMTTELGATFRLSQSSDVVTLTRTVAAAVLAYNNRQDTIDCYAYQYPTIVALVCEFWLAYRLNRQRSVKFDAFLHALALRPGDTILVNVTDGDGGTVLSSMPARISLISHQAADARRQTMERITITAEYCLWPWTVTGIVPPVRDCNAPIGTPTGPYSTTLPIGSLGNTTASGGVDGMPTWVSSIAYEPINGDTGTTGGFTNGAWFWGKITSTVSAPSSSLDNFTTCTVDVWVPDPASMTTPPPFVVTTDTTLLGLTVVNRDKSLSVGSGKMCKIVFRSNADGTGNGEWSFSWVECDV